MALLNNNFKEIYSLNEIRIGTWIDGKPMYKKCFTGSIIFIENTESKLILQKNFREYGQLININGYIHMPYKENIIYDYVFPCAGGSNYIIGLVDNNNDLEIIVKWDSPGLGSFVAIVYYTKNLDLATIDLSVVSNPQNNILFTDFNFPLASITSTATDSFNINTNAVKEEKKRYIL